MLVPIIIGGNAVLALALFGGKKKKKRGAKLVHTAEGYRIRQRKEGFIVEIPTPDGHGGVKWEAVRDPQTQLVIAAETLQAALQLALSMLPTDLPAPVPGPGPAPGPGLGPDPEPEPGACAAWEEPGGYLNVALEALNSRRPVVAVLGCSSTGHSFAEQLCTTLPPEARFLFFPSKVLGENAEVKEICDVAHATVFIAKPWVDDALNEHVDVYGETTDLTLHRGSEMDFHKLRQWVGHVVRAEDTIPGATTYTAKEIQEETQYQPQQGG